MRRLLSSLLLSAFALSSMAQSESALWMSAEASVDLTRRWGADLELGTRIGDNWQQPMRYNVGFGFDYKAFKWLKVGAGYICIRDYHPSETEVLYKTNDDGSIRLDSDGNRVVKGINADDAFWRTKQRLYFDLTEKWKVGRFGFALRERYQFTRNLPTDVFERKFREEYEADEMGMTHYDPSLWYGPVANVNDLNPSLSGQDFYYYELDADKTGPDTKSGKSKHNFRTRLTIDYNIRRCPVTPFVSYELANNLCDRFSVVRHRAQAGIDWNLTKSKQHALSLAYLYQHGAEDEAGRNDLHVLSIGYKFRLETAKAKAQKAAKKKKK